MTPPHFYIFVIISPLKRTWGLFYKTTYDYDQILSCLLLSNLGQFENSFNCFKNNLDRYISGKIFKRNYQFFKIL
jgi:hypothetical protein